MNSVTTRYTAACERTGKSARSVFVLNASSNLFLIGLQAIIGLAISRAIVTELGIAAYGIVALAVTFPNYIKLAANGITTSVLRFIVLAKEEGRLDDGARYANTAIIFVAGLAFVLGSVTPFASDRLAGYLNMPPEFVSEGRVLIALSLLAAAFSVVQGSLQVAFAATNTFYLQNLLLSCVRVACGVSVLVVLLAGSASLIAVGIYYAATSLLSALVLACFRPRYQLGEFRLRSFSFRALTKLLRFGLWVFVDDAAVLLFFSAAIVAVNRYIGTAETGAFGAVMLVNSFVVMVIGSITNVITPVVFRAAKEQNRALSLFRLSQLTRSLLFATGIPVCVFCGAAVPLLSLWLGEQHAYLWPYILAFTLTTWLGGTMSAIPLLHLRGRDRASLAALANFGCAAGYIGTVVLLLRTTSAGLAGVAIAYVLYFGVRGLVMAELILGRLSDERSSGVITDAVKACFVASLAIAVGHASGSMFHGEALAGLLASVSAVLVTYCAGAKLLLTTEDRTQILSLFSAGLQSKILRRARARQ